MPSQAAAGDEDWLNAPDCAADVATMTATEVGRRDQYCGTSSGEETGGWQVSTVEGADDGYFDDVSLDDFDELEQGLTKIASSRPSGGLSVGTWLKKKMTAAWKDAQETLFAEVFTSPERRKYAQLRVDEMNNHEALLEEGFAPVTQTSCFDDLDPDCEVPLGGTGIQSSKQGLMEGASSVMAKALFGWEVHKCPPQLTKCTVDTKGNVHYGWGQRPGSAR